MKRPKSWLDITVSQFQELHTLNRDDFDYEDDYVINFLSIILNESVDKIEELDITVYDELLKEFSWIHTLPSREPRPHIITDAGILHLKDDFTKLLIGEFIDLENLFTESYIKNLQLLLTIFYRVKEDKQSLLYENYFEPYGTYIFHRKNLFDDISIDYVYGILTKYLKFRTDLFTAYEGLFDSPEIEEEVDMELIKDKKSFREEEQYNKTVKKWGFDIMLLKLANNDPTKIGLVTEMTLLQGLNVLSMRKELKIGEN